MKLAKQLGTPNQMSKKKIKDTKLGSWLADKAPQVLGVEGDLLPDSGGLGIVTVSYTHQKLQTTPYV